MQTDVTTGSGATVSFRGTGMTVIRLGEIARADMATLLGSADGPPRANAARADAANVAPVEPGDVLILVPAGSPTPSEPMVRAAAAWRQNGGGPVVVACHEEATAEASEEHAVLAQRLGASVVMCRARYGTCGPDDVEDLVRGALLKIGIVGVDPAEVLRTLDGPTRGELDSLPAEDAERLPEDLRQKMNAADRLLVEITYVASWSLSQINEVWSAVLGVVPERTDVVLSCPEGARAQVRILSLENIPALIDRGAGRAGDGA